MQTLSKSKSSWLTKIEKHLLTINQKQATGELIVGNRTSQWRLCFFLGHLVYAIGDNHRVRRWERILKKHCPNWVPETHLLSSNELWECQLLHQGIMKGQLSAAQVKAVMRETTQEVLFSLIRLTNVTGYWYPCEYRDARVAFYPPICPLEIREILQSCQILYDKWQKMGVGYLDPELVPVLKQSVSRPSQCSVDTFLDLTALFNGRYTIWDIGLKLKQPIDRIARLIHHFLQQGVVELQTIPDLPSPLSKPHVDSKAKKPTSIACVDDSPLIGKCLKEVLHPVGYQLVYIQDPIQAVSTLSDCKPDLLFLDIVMPKTDGYNVCSFLRRSSTFGNTPIVMLTGCDGLINRVRAKLVGANDFLAKPFQGEQVLQMVKKHLPSEDK